MTDSRKQRALRAAKAICDYEDDAGYPVRMERFAEIIEAEFAASAATNAVSGDEAPTNSKFIARREACVERAMSKLANLVFTRGALADLLRDVFTQGSKLSGDGTEAPTPGIDKLLHVIRTWMETESGPTMAKFSHPELQVQVSIHGYKKIILERTFAKGAASAESASTNEESGRTK